LAIGGYPEDSSATAFGPRATPVDAISRRRALAVWSERSAGDPCGDEACPVRRMMRREKKTLAQGMPDLRGGLETA